MNSARNYVNDALDLIRRFGLIECTELLPWNASQYTTQTTVTTN